MATPWIHLVRHGQSTWNAERRLQGQTHHPPLTPAGRDDATRAAGELAGLISGRPARLVSSDLVRARQTADIIGTRLGLAVHEERALREQHLGTMEGRLTAELHPEPVPEGMHISEVRWAGGESLRDVHDRLSAFFAAVLPTAPEHLVVVTHGDTLRVARAVLTGRSHREIEWDLVANGAVVTLSPSRPPSSPQP